MSLPYLQPYLGLSNGLNTLHAAGGGGAVGGWKELGRTTLGSSGDTIAVSSLTDKRYYMVLQNVLHSGSAPDATRLGYSSVDTGTNYANRYSTNGGADNLFTSINRCIDYSPTVSGDESFAVSYLANRSANEKLMIKHRVGRQASGATTAPNRSENFNKWANTSNPLDIFQVTNIDTGDYLTGSEVVVLGYDPADDDTNGYWQELGEFTGTSPSGSITAKKYLWVQAYIEGTSTGKFQCGYSTLDSGSNYASRYSGNGGADSTGTSYTGSEPLTVTTPIFYNIFIINNASNEKLAIIHGSRQSTAGAGNAPNRFEEVLKWTNTSNQINILGFVAHAGSLNSKCHVKVWGAN